jgi:hypothetical protein
MPGGESILIVVGSSKFWNVGILVVTVTNFAATRFLYEEMNLMGSEVCRIPKNALLVYAY